jgi:hypothetical protein
MYLLQENQLEKFKSFLGAKLDQNDSHFESNSRAGNLTKVLNVSAEEMEQLVRQNA